MPPDLILQRIAPLVEVLVKLAETLCELLRARLAEVGQTGFQAVPDRSDIHALGDGDYLHAVWRPPCPPAGGGYLLADSVEVLRNLVRCDSHRGRKHTTNNLSGQGLWAMA